MASWSALTGNRLERWELSVLREIDMEFLRIMRPSDDDKRKK